MAPNSGIEADQTRRIFLEESLHTFLRDADRLDHLLQGDLMGGMIELLLLQPSQIAHGPGLRPREDAAMLEHEATHSLAIDALGLDRGRPGANQESRIASWPASGTHTAVSSPARKSLARAMASRRLVLTRSPGFLGISKSATTVQG